MRLAGPIFSEAKDPDSWVRAVKAEGYTAANCPVGPETPEDEVKAFVRAAERADIVIAEVGAWSNPISRDDAERANALERCQRDLALADRIGARCCVNIAGSRGPRWDGPDPANFTAETFDLIVQSVRQIIDAVKPMRTFYTLETMPWVPPDSPDSYLDLVKAIDRKQFAVHLDPVNMINSPRRAADTGAFIRECFAKLGPFIKGCHAKDIKYTQHLTLHLDECGPGEGLIDFRTYLQELAKLPADTTLFMEHLSTAEQYRAAAAHLRSVASDIGATWR